MGVADAAVVARTLHQHCHKLRPWNAEKKPVAPPPPEEPDPKAAELHPPKPSSGRKSASGDKAKHAKSTPAPRPTSKQGPKGGKTPAPPDEEAEPTITTCVGSCFFPFANPLSLPLSLPTPRPLIPPRTHARMIAVILVVSLALGLYFKRGLFFSLLRRY